MLAAVVLVLGAFMGLRAFAATQADHDGCSLQTAEPDIDAVIAACSAVIADQEHERQEDVALAYVIRGTAQYIYREYDKAIADYSSAIRLKPDLVIAYYNRGIAYQEKGDWDRAIADYDRAILLSPDDLVLYINRGLVRAAKGQLDLAIADYDRAIELSPNSALPYNNRGVVYARKNDHVRAIADYNRAIELFPGYAHAWLNRGRSYFELHDYDRAVADTKQALLIDPSSNLARENLKEAEDAKAALLAQGQAAPTGKRIALVIGNAIYQNAPRLPNAANDTDDVAAELRKLGYEVFGSPKTDFTRTELTAAIEAFKRKAVGADAAVVWYAGHGKQMREEGSDAPRDWVIPVDAKINSRADVATNALPLNQLQLAVLAAKRLRLVVVDACRNNTFYGEGRGTRGLGRPTSSPGVLVVYSTTPGDQAQDGQGRNSPFAQAFLEAVRAKPGADIRQLFATVSGRTRDLTRGEQKPQTFSDLSSGDALTLEPR